MVFVGSGSVSFDSDLAQLFIRILIQGNDTDPADPEH